MVRRAGRALSAVLRALISLGLIGWLAREVEWAEVGRVVAASRWPWLVAALAPMVINRLVAAARWRWLLSARGVALAWRLAVLVVDLAGGVLLAVHGVGRRAEAPALPPMAAERLECS